MIALNNLDQGTQTYGSWAIGSLAKSSYLAHEQLGGREEEGNLGGRKGEETLTLVAPLKPAKFCFIYKLGGWMNGLFCQAQFSFRLLCSAVFFGLSLSLCPLLSLRHTHKYVC